MTAEIPTYADTVFSDQILFDENEFSFRAESSLWKLVTIDATHMIGREIRTGCVELGTQELFTYDEHTRLTIINSEFNRPLQGSKTGD